MTIFKVFKDKDDVLPLFVVYLRRINRDTRMKDFFAMSRHERMGTIMILVIIVLLLAGSVAVRSCRYGEDSALMLNDKAFEASVDSILSDTAARVEPATERKTSKPSSKKRTHTNPPSKSKPRQAPAPRKMDPMPQF